MIDGVVVKQLKVMADERGFLMEMVKNTDIEKFGQTYVTTAYPGVVKAWHYHKKQTDNFVVIKGMMKVVLYDDRIGVTQSPTYGEVNEFFMGDQNRIMLKIPPFIWHGFKCISTEMAYVINTPTEVYNPKEPDEFRKEAHTIDIPYCWGRNDG